MALKVIGRFGPKFTTTKRTERRGPLRFRGKRPPGDNSTKRTRMR